MDALVPVIFRFPGTLAPGAGQVAVVGSFNAWNPTAHLLTKTADGDWAITIYLPPGRTVYLFAADGAFWLDPRDEGRIPNGWGSEYSIRYIRQRMRRNRARSFVGLRPGGDSQDAETYMSVGRKKVDPR